MAILNGIKLTGSDEVHQLDYKKVIANKPFYSEQGEVDILPKADYEFAKEENDNLYTYYHTFELETDSDYIVEWDGATYNLSSVSMVMEDETTFTYLGNASILGLGDDTSEPFLVLDSTDLKFTATTDTATSHNIRIYQNGEVVHQIDSKFVNAYTKEEINEMLGVYVDEVKTLLGGDE